jgi:hypothetical protein
MLKLVNLRCKLCQEYLIDLTTIVIDIVWTSEIKVLSKLSDFPGILRDIV